MFQNQSRTITSAIVSVIFVFYAFNFNPQGIAILATRSLAIQIFDYILNFAIFFIIAYLILSLFNFVRNKLFSRSK